MRVLLVLAAIALAGAVYSPDWNFYPETGVPPAERYGYAIGYRNTTQELVVFGGSNILNIWNDIYVFNTVTKLWKPLPVLSDLPPARFYTTGTMLTDKLFLVFGGTNAAGIGLNDLWAYSFESNTWSPIIPASGATPAGRYRAELFTLDAYPGQFFMYGGTDPQTFYHDFWMFDWDTRAWTQILVDGFDSSLQPDLYNGRVTTYTDTTFVVVVGQTVALETYVVDFTDITNTSFTKITVTSTDRPDPRYIFGLSMWQTGGGTQDGMYVHWGWNDGAKYSFGDLWRLNMATGAWTQLAFDGNVRDSLTAIRAGSTIWYFAGWGIDVYNDMYSLDLTQPCTATACDMNMISDVIVTPPRMYGHSAVRIANEMYIFGGSNGFANLNSLWSYQLDNRTWTDHSLQSGGPTARVYHSASALGVRMLVFGGQLDNGNGNDELWEFNAAAETGPWRQLTQSGARPSARWGHTTCILGTWMILYGGESVADVSPDKMWAYDMLNNYWVRLLPTVANSEPATSYLSRMLPIGNNQVVIIGGVDGATLGETKVYTVAIDLTARKATWTTTGVNLPRSVYGQATMVMDGTLVISGGQWYEFVYNRTLAIPVDVAMTGAPVELSPVCAPPNRGSHSAVVYGNRGIIFGGFDSSISGPLLSVGVTTYVRNDAYELEFPLCSASATAPYSAAGCIRCAPGTVAMGGACVACPGGSYSDQTGAASCTQCPAGFYNTLEGADTIQFCLPCDIGTYSGSAGATECSPCPDGMFCVSLGTVTPRASLDTFEAGVVASQPGVLTDPRAAARDATKARVILGFITLGIIIVVFIIFAVTVKISDGFLRLYWRKADCFFSLGHKAYSAIGEPVHKMKTVFGGLFSVLAIVLIVWNTINVIIPLFADNLQVSRSLVSNLLLQGVPTANITIAMVLQDYQGVCAPAGNGGVCSPLVSIILYQVVTNSSTPPTLTCADLGGRSCQVTWDCQGCSLSAATTSVFMSFQDDNTALSAYQWTVKTSSGLPTQYSTITGSLLPDNNYLFRGLSSASVITFRTTPVTYSSLTNNTAGTGYLLNFVDSSKGSQVDPIAYYTTNGASIYVAFQTQDVSMEVVVDEAVNIQVILSVAAGAASAMLGVAGLIMGTIESLLPRGTLEPTKFDMKIERGETPDAPERQLSSFRNMKGEDLYKRKDTGGEEMMKL